MHALHSAAPGSIPSISDFFREKIFNVAELTAAITLLKLWTVHSIIVVDRTFSGLASGKPVLQTTLLCLYSLEPDKTKRQRCILTKNSSFKGLKILFFLQQKEIF